jgi:DNA-binding transcriptional regulator YdaS (Cro superfamily)
MRAYTSSELIDLLDGTNAVANLFGIKPPSVSEWRHKGIPEDKLIRMAPLIEQRSKGKWKRWDLRPNDWWLLWPELRKAKGAPRIPEQEGV